MKDYNNDKSVDGNLESNIRVINNGRKDKNVGSKVGKRSSKKAMKMHSLEREKIREYIQHQLSETKIELISAQRGFDDVTDPDLLDYYTYLYKSTLAKHAYYMKRMKQLYYNDRLS